MQLTLRAPEPSDVDMLFRLENETDVRSVSWGQAPISRQMIWEYVNSYTADIYRDKQLRLLIDVDGAAIGAVDLSDFDPDNSRAMVGIALLPEWRGRGVGMQAMEALLQFCRTGLCMHQLVAIVPRDNDSSLKLFMAAKFKTAGCLRSWIRRGSAYVDAVILQRLFGN